MFVIDGRDKNFIKSTDRMVAMIVSGLSKPRPKKYSTRKQTTVMGKVETIPDAKPVASLIPEACRIGREMIPGDLKSMMHQACHKLTGRCVPVSLEYLDGKMGDFARTGDSNFRIRVHENVAIDGQLKTFLHEAGHVRHYQLFGATGDENNANFWRDAWTGKYKVKALEMFGKCDPYHFLRAIIEES